MNFTEAKSFLDQGKKVRLPEWTGYWFKDGDAIKVFTRTGDVLDTPMIEEFSKREDWLVANDGLGFDFALLALKAGKKVAREGWNGKGQFIVKAGGYSVANDKVRADTHFTKEFLEAEGAEAFNIANHLDLWNAQKVYVPGWVPSQGDLFAEDWMIVK